MDIEILKNYDFLEKLVKDGQLDPSQPFLKNGICYTEDKKECFFVFHCYDNCIWWTYAYRKYNNKRFKKFFHIFEQTLLNMDIPTYRIGKNNDMKKSFELEKIVNNVKIYKLKKRGK